MPLQVTVRGAERCIVAMGDSVSAPGKLTAELHLKRMASVVVDQNIQAAAVCNYHVITMPPPA